MKIHYEQPRTVTKTASLQNEDADSHGQALEAARAEFRAAWQAKQDRANRLRARAEKAQRVETWAAWNVPWNLWVVYVLVLFPVVVGGWVDFGSTFRFVGLLVLLRGMTYCGAWVTRAVFTRATERLEPAEIHYP